MILPSEMSIPGPPNVTRNLAAPSMDPPESMTAALLEPLERFQQLSVTLFQSLAPPQTRPPPAPSIAAFLECDAAMADALRLVQVHQMKQRRIESLKVEVLSVESKLRDVWMALEEGRRELETIVDEGDERIKAIEQAKTASIPYPELLSYAQSLSAFTSAPPNMPDLAPGHLPPPLFFPPFPNEEKMRRGRLNAEAPLGFLGETHSVGRPPTRSPAVQLDPISRAPGAQHSFRADHPPQPSFFDLDLDLNPDL